MRVLYSNPSTRLVYPPTTPPSPVRCFIITMIIVIESLLIDERHPAHRHYRCPSHSFNHTHTHTQCSNQVRPLISASNTFTCTSSLFFSFSFIHPMETSTIWTRPGSVWRHFQSRKFTTALFVSLFCFFVVDVSKQFAEEGINTKHGRILRRRTHHTPYTHTRN